MSYAVKEIFYTLQGEGVNVGRAAVFCRFSGCNLWSGREEDRSSAICKFCDTDFIGIGLDGGKFENAWTLATEIESKCPQTQKRFVVFTGGEPLLQLDYPLIYALHQRDFEIAVETNGTILAPTGVDWVCVSPKAGATLRQNWGDELKLVYPQPEALPDKFNNLWFKNFFLQPMDGPNLKENTQLALQYCLDNPRWRLSIQTHKLVGIR